MSALLQQAVLITEAVFVSGRLCLFGEHSDWAGEHAGVGDITAGRCLVVGTQEGLHANVTALPEKVLRMVAHDDTGEAFGPVELPLDPQKLLAAARTGGFWSYVAGVAYRVVLHHHIEGGLEIINHTTTLPLSKGLSSSAAVCVLVARAFNKLYNLHLSIRGEMEFAYLGEITTPSKCGRMDQACAYGSIPISMEFDRDILTVNTVQLSAPLHLVLVDLKANKCTTTILTKLQAHYPNPQGEVGRKLHALLGPVNLGVTARALEAMVAGDVEGLGRLMCEAQGVFDEAAGAACPEQLKAPVLHRVLRYEPLQDLTWGGKGVGSQGDGAAQFLCKGKEAQAKVCDILTADLGLHCLPLTVAPTATAAAGAGGGGGQQGCAAAVTPPPGAAATSGPCSCEAGVTDAAAVAPVQAVGSEAVAVGAAGGGLQQEEAVARGATNIIPSKENTAVRGTAISVSCQASR